MEKEALYGPFFVAGTTDRERSTMLDFNALFEPVIDSMGYELVGVEFVGSEHNGILRVYIDKPGGVTIDDCAQVSHQLSALLDVEDPIGHRYSLEVSSPGIDRPLFKLDDYRRFVGLRARIKLATPLQGRRNFTGQLRGVEDDRVLIEVDKELHELPWPDIARAHLVDQV
jgi:ribosome maturation factor RimP